MAAEREQYAELPRDLLSAELLNFIDKYVSESVSSKIECSHVIIRRIDGGKHWIVVLNESIEVSTYAVDEIAQLHHVEDENLMKWRGADDDDDVWNLVVFKDKIIADNFAKMVENFSKCSLQTVTTQINQIVHVYSPVKTEFVLSEEEKSVPVRLSNQMPVKVESFATPPTSSTKSVFEDKSISKTTLAQPGESNEAMASENDTVTDDMHSSPVPKPATDDLDDNQIPLSPVDTNDDGKFRSSTPTSKMPPYSAFVAGMTQSTNMEQDSSIAQNEQYKAKKKKPKTLSTTVDLRQDCATPDLSEKSTLSRVGACFFDTSRGTDDDEGYHMELDDSYERYYSKMVKCYNKTLTYYWSKHSSGGSLLHKVIAALVCQNGKSCYTAILSTGTYHNDRDKCGFTSTCDGHAVSICYEAAPKYFLEEIKSLKNKEDSIFEYLPNKEGFRLKQGVSFHLFVTQFPCGFIRDQKEPCMEWKIPFAEYPHVPTCSTRILIGATMGIQGYISHLLDKPIMIDSLVILCADIDKAQVLDVGSVFKMPNMVKTMKYNPEDFRPGFFFPSKYSPNTSTTEHVSQCNVSYESTDGNETAKSLGPGLEDAQDSCATMAIPDKNTNSVFFKFDPRTAQEVSSDNEFSIKTRDVDQSLEVNEKIKVDRISRLKQLYGNLADQLKLEEALQILSTKLDAEIKKKEEMMLSLLQSAAKELTEVVPDTLNTNTIQEWDNYLRKQKTKLHHIGEEGRTKIRNRNMIMCIQSTLANKQNMIMDCNWHQYLNASPSSFQPTRDEWYS